MIDIVSLKRNKLRKQWRHMQMIFQDPYSSLNQRMTVKEIIGESLIANRLASGKEINKQVEEIAFFADLKRDSSVAILMHLAGVSVNGLLLQERWLCIRNSLFCD